MSRQKPQQCDYEPLMNCWIERPHGKEDRICLACTMAELSKALRQKQDALAGIQYNMLAGALKMLGFLTEEDLKLLIGPDEPNRLAK